MSGSTMSKTSHHFSRTFMMSRGYARAATVRANSRQPDDRRWTIDDGRSTIDDGLLMLHLLHAPADEIDEHVLERRLALGQRRSARSAWTRAADHGAEHALFLQDQLDRRAGLRSRDASPCARRQRRRAPPRRRRRAASSRGGRSAPAAAAASGSTAYRTRARARR